ncbi:hypothetical protein [Cellulomonas telluris]|uniref:hypothetical protein n=1 Tax=Cellulomonas telluris TaxID=2306636 RepID=UPI0010A77ACD|nr:hypothetical protein [Cellulomonas telluris]
MAMTRGRQDNHAYVAIDDVIADCDGIPNSDPMQDGQDVLASILATSGAELSATQTIARQQDAVASLRRPEPVRRTIIADVTAPRWRQMLERAGVAAELLGEVSRSPLCGCPLLGAGEG